MKIQHKPVNYTRLGGTIQRAAGDDGKNQTRFTISFSSETPDRRYGCDEVLLHGADNVSLDRLRQAGTLLWHHGMDPGMGTMPIGGLENIQLDETSRRCTAEIVFDEDDEEAMRICNKVRKGYLTGVSVRARVMEWIVLGRDEKSADGRFAGPAYLANKWEPIEVSVESCPADPSVGVGRSLTTEGGIEEMPEPINTVPVTNPAAPAAEPQRTAGQQPAAAVPPVVTPAVPTAPAADHQRTAAPAAGTDVAAQILARCAQFDLPISTANDYVSRRLTMDQVNASILDHMTARSGALPGSVQVVADELDKFRAAAVDGMLLRGGLAVDKPAAGASKLRGVRLRDLAFEASARMGKQLTRTISDEQLLRSVLTPDSAFVGILSDAVHKAMATQYAAAGTTYQLWTSKGSNVDFKPKKIITISEAGDLSKMTQNGELKFDEMSDTGVESVLCTYGKEFGFTRQALINDDLDMLTRLPAAYVRAAKRGVNKMVYKILQDNPTMGDGSALFSSTHGNLATGANPSVASYQDAFGKMMHQRGLRGIESLNIRPKFIICDPFQYAAHAAIVRSTSSPASSNAGVLNPFGPDGMPLQLIMDADLLASATATGANPYFFAADPNECSTIEVSYLNGVEEPLLESQLGFDFLGIKWRIYQDVGVTLVDYRGLVKNPDVAD